MKEGAVFSRLVGRRGIGGRLKKFGSLTEGEEPLYFFLL
jgi:hypothetical protein